MNTATDTLQGQIETLILGTKETPPEHDQVPPKEIVAAPTVAELEDAWGHTREGWELLGSPAQDDEPLAIVRHVRDRELDGHPEATRVYYTVERTDEDGISYVAIDRWFDLDAIGADVICQHDTGEAARPEREVVS